MRSTNQMLVIFNILEPESFIILFSDINKYTINIFGIY